MTTENIEEAARESISRVALVTCGEVPFLDPDDRLLLDPLASHGVRAEPAVWDDPRVAWAGYDLAVLRSTWDYAPRRDEFIAWAGRVPALANPADVVAWNTDKGYLADLASAGVPVVPTTWVAPDETWHAPLAWEYVIKPAVGAGSLDAGRYRLADPRDRALATAHVERLQAAGRVVMVQPYLRAVDSYGETALLFVAGPDGLSYSHAIRKGPMLTGPDHGVDGLYRPEEITPRVPTEAEREVARRALAAIPGGTAGLLYARVDLIPGRDDEPLLVELELTEPSLFLGHADGAAERLAAGIAARAAVRRT
ncbi:MAG TPA: hypothetical protein VFR67_23675 [Pilimelia sp.]|nr:hypothetical protein [Pilimelia sp.]